MRSRHLVLLGVAVTVGAGLLARAVIMSRLSYGGRYFSVGAWVTGVAALTAAAIALRAPRRPYVAGAAGGFLGVTVTTALLFWRESSWFWAAVVLALGVGAGAIGAFAGIVVRWLLGGRQGAGT